MTTIRELEEIARNASDHDIDATTTLICIARAFIMKYREDRLDPGLLVALAIAVDAQRESAHARILASAAWCEACAMQAVMSP